MTETHDNADFAPLRPIAALDELRADDVVTVRRGTGPIILGQPHVGLGVPRDVAATFNATGNALGDTDWWVDRLYDGLTQAATVVSARVSRYVIDVNRDPLGASLYPGQATTGLCPLTDFDGRKIYRTGAEPGEAEIGRRCERVHAVYHAALGAEIARLRARHDAIVVYDCHSIRSRVPRLFEGLLPTYNIGTNDGVTCAPALADAAAAACRSHAPDDWVMNARFKGGWVTRRYGRPGDGIHAIQMEVAQRAYLGNENPPWPYDDARAGVARGVLADVLNAIMQALAQMQEPSRPQAAC